MSSNGHIESSSVPLLETPPDSDPCTDKTGDSSAEACQLLRSAMPSYDTMMDVLRRQGTWWNSYRQKVQVISSTSRIEPLLDFATRVYTTNNPSELATLAVAYARSIGGAHDILERVESTIISKTAYVATITGLECLIILGKTYTDFGQPRRAWLVWKRGMAIAQLMGLHLHNRQLPQSHQQIWWCIYHGERFMSLLLGLPSGFNDNLYELELAASLPGLAANEGWMHYFVLGCAIEAGRIVERNLLPQHYHTDTRDSYERLEALQHLPPDEWWKVPTALPPRGMELDGLVNRMLVHLFFFQVQMYFHLPSMADSDGNQGGSTATSKHTCKLAARELLTRYLLLRRQVEGAYVFDCKTSDFVGFTAVVILLLSQHGHSINPPSDDKLLIQNAKDIFDELAVKTGCSIAAQFNGVLDLLCARDKYGTGKDSPAKVVIPLFGSILWRRLPSVDISASPRYPDSQPQLSDEVAIATPDYSCFFQQSSTLLSQPGSCIDEFAAYGSFWGDGIMWDLDMEWHNNDAI
ncbi:hypothetical protein B0I35DRAFT_444162 [Stachybotrys elegans]|uniref:Xylanolytic transcriptional activator regulatory domain-containing protein n=1 Tax=Stachybotrys elegans TaxID=80388 RepID=A0A8K0SDJ1_9HYPO|nr:hypothetical protein B0I35DRAFT_444162 [Stachybotrys elegans]